MCRYFFIGFIDFVLAGKTLTEFTKLFSQNNFKNHKYKMKSYCFKSRKDTENINPRVSDNEHPLYLATHQLAEELHKPIIRKLKKNSLF